MSVEWVRAIEFVSALTMVKTGISTVSARMEEERTVALMNGEYYA